MLSLALLITALVTVTSVSVHEVHADVESLPDAFKTLYPSFHPTVATLPEQIHLVLGDDDGSVAVLWSTAERHRAEPSRVHYGEGEDNFTLTAVADSDELFLGNALGCHGVYRAVMSDLRPRTYYSYRVQTGAHYSRSYHFTSPDTATDRPSSFLVYGDLGKIGGGYTLRQLQKEVDSGHYDAIIHVGDFAYDFHCEDGRRGDDFMNRIEPLASRLPYMPCPGNHEIENGFSHYRYRFSTPDTPWPIPPHKMWYSFNSGLVHFISYSTEAYFTDGQLFVPTQYSWLSDNLRAANRERHVRPWIVAFGHRPMYCSNLDRDDCTRQISELRTEPYNLERLFHTAGVDLIIEAHEHSYERLYPLYNGTQTDCGYANPRAAVHVISGAAGCNEREMLCADVILNDVPHWSAERSWLPGLNGFGRLTVPNATHLLWEQTLSISDEPLDRFWLTQTNHSRRSERVTERRCPR